MTIRVFVQNEAGSNQKNFHDEKTLTFATVVRSLTRIHRSQPRTAPCRGESASFLGCVRSGG